MLQIIPANDVTSTGHFARQFIIFMGYYRRQPASIGGVPDENAFCGNHCPIGGGDSDRTIRRLVGSVTMIVPVVANPHAYL